VLFVLVVLIFVVVSIFCKAKMLLRWFCGRRWKLGMKLLFCSCDYYKKKKSAIVFGEKISSSKYVCSFYSCKSKLDHYELWVR
jgi:hypothetical protein